MFQTVAVGRCAMAAQRDSVTAAGWANPGRPARRDELDAVQACRTVLVPTTECRRQTDRTKGISGIGWVGSARTEDTRRDGKVKLTATPEEEGKTYRYGFQKNVRPKRDTRILDQQRLQRARGSESTGPLSERNRWEGRERTQVQIDGS